MFYLQNSCFFPATPCFLFMVFPALELVSKSAFSSQSAAHPLIFDVGRPPPAALGVTGGFFARKHNSVPRFGSDTASSPSLQAMVVVVIGVCRGCCRDALGFGGICIRAINLSVARMLAVWCL